MKAALYLIMLAFPPLRARTEAEDADRHARRKVASSHSSTHRRLARHDSPDIVRRLRADAAWPAGPGMHLRTQLVHHAKVCHMAWPQDQDPG
jgi:hypothetical protein